MFVAKAPALPLWSWTLELPERLHPGLSASGLSTEKMWFSTFRLCVFSPVYTRYCARVFPPLNTDARMKLRDSGVFCILSFIASFPEPRKVLGIY